MMTLKRNMYAPFAFRIIHLNIYRKGTQIDDIWESIIIESSFDISREYMIMYYWILEHVEHFMNYNCARFRLWSIRKNTTAYVSFTILVV